MGEQLEDEITSINAIYTDDTFKIASISPTICSLQIPTCSVSLRLEFPADYPDAPPSILGTQSVGDDIPKGVGSEVIDLARHILSITYTPGSPCIYDLLEDLSSQLPDLLNSESQTGPSIEMQAGLSQSTYEISPHMEPDHQQSLPELSTPPQWVLSDVVTEKKSVFIARAATVDSTEQAKAFLHHFLVTDKKAARATHNITAWRIRGPNDVAFQDCDDDGETAAGGRLLHLLQLMEAWNVMVVVTRWYGGVHLGPDRFRIINQVAREAVVAGDWGKDAAAGKGKTGKKK
ncbi:ribosomal protein S5 domain 2-type protein [Elsinoe ampelina]|uniref:Ribosomal protein S5 domain 2-type protein n=1 Tax=Elsinoe ampelina TaxID=302913 RepID=A0A6A6G4Y5_9PEZI|nr:ribosomal protein S5 domain 2-type protein [Elsinoe ampelina]